MNKDAGIKESSKIEIDITRAIYLRNFKNKDLMALYADNLMHHSGNTFIRLRNRKLNSSL